MELNVISFNIRCANDPNGNSIAERAPRLAEVTSKYDAHILGFQEYTPKWAPFIEKYYGNEYEIFNKYRTRFIRRESSPILWKKDRFECEKTGYFWLSDTPEVQSRGWDEKYNCFRICEYVVLRDKKTKEAFTIMNTHFGFGEKGQRDSAELIYKYSKKISPYPTFVTGDFNMIPHSLGYMTMTKYFTDVNSVTAKDCRPTFHNYNLGKIEPKHIDFCFTDSSITPVDYKIIDELPDGKFPSDHYGLYINLVL